MKSLLLKLKINNEKILLEKTGILQKWIKEKLLKKQDDTQNL